MRAAVNRAGRRGQESEGGLPRAACSCQIERSSAMREMNESAPASEYRSSSSSSWVRTWDFFGGEMEVVDTRRPTLLDPTAAVLHPLVLFTFPCPPPPPPPRVDEELSSGGQTDFGQPHPSINPTFCTGYRSPLAQWGAPLHTYASPPLIFFLPVWPPRSGNFQVKPHAA